MCVHAPYSVWGGSIVVCDKGGVASHGDGMAATLARGEVFMMVPMCYLDKAFFVVWSVGYVVCATQQIVMDFTWFSLINRVTLSSSLLMYETNLMFLFRKKLAF